MTATFFKTDANEVTPFGIWIATWLNKALYAISFTRLKTMDEMQDYYLDQIDDLEQAFETDGRSLLFNPTRYYEPEVKHSVDEYSMADRYEFRLEPLRGGVAMQFTNSKRYDVRPEIKNLLIRQAGKSWKAEGEMQMAKFLESFEIINGKQIY